MKVVAAPPDDPDHAIPRPERIGWNGWRIIVGRTLSKMAKMDVSLRCAGVAFFGFVSLFPGIAITFFLIGLFADRAFLFDQVERLNAFLPPIALDVLVSRLSELESEPVSSLGIGLLVSIVVVLWSGSRGMNALIYAATIAHTRKRRRTALGWLTLSVVVTLAGSLFLIVSLSLVAAVPIVAGLSPIPGSAERFALWLRWPILLVIAMAGITLLYAFTLERRPARLRWLWPGALLATILWLATCVLFSLYVENVGGFESTFGSLAAAVVLLLWMYNSALIFVLGSTFNAQVELYTTQDTTIGRDRPMGERGAYPADHVLVEEGAKESR